MTKPEIESAILRALKKIAPEAELTDVDENESLQQAFDIDSFDYLNLLVALRDELGVTIEEADYDKLCTLKDMVSFLLPGVSALETL